MPVNVLFSARAELWSEYEPLLKQGLANAGLDFNLATNIPAAQVDYVVYAPDGGLRDFS